MATPAHLLVRPSEASLFAKETIKRFFAQVRKTPHCWWWIGPPGNGYGAFTVRGKTFHVHRYSWRLAHKKRPIPSNRWVLHSCDNSLCVNPKHLSLGAPRRNIRETIARSRPEWRVFTEAETRQIARLLRKGERYARLAQRYSGLTLAKKYKTTERTMRRIKNGQYEPYDKELRRR